jgi:hypothetical protein
MANAAWVVGPRASEHGGVVKRVKASNAAGARAVIRMQPGWWGTRASECNLGGEGARVSECSLGGGE